MLIGISGLAGAGKDTCADFLVRKHGFVKVGFADVMKRICRDVYGFSVEQLWGPSAFRNAPDGRLPRKHTSDSFCRCCGADIGSMTTAEASKQHPCYLTPRFALQQLGSEWGRVCYPNTWVDYALRVAEAVRDGCYYDPSSHCNTLFRISSPSPGHVVISDVRFKNEIDALKTAGAKLIRIVRPGAGLVGAAAQHGSEIEQSSILNDVFDVTIVNGGTLTELEEVVTHMTELWLT